jgi:hypothetical protein
MRLDRRLDCVALESLIKLVSLDGRRRFDAGGNRFQLSIRG